MRLLLKRCWRQVRENFTGENLMKPKLLLTLTAIYMGLVGLFNLISPAAAFSLDAGATAVLIASVRVVASLYIGFAVVNWFARSAEASQARDAILLGNTVGIALAAILFALVALAPGGQAGIWVIVVINLLFVVAFFVVGRVNMSMSAR
jgi:hypothetical protein